MSISPQDLLARRKTLTKFDDLHKQVVKLSELNYPDTVIPLKNIRVVPIKEGKGVKLDVPQVGVLKLNDWSKKQLGALLGINWDKWFDTSFIRPQEIEDELALRFTRMGHEAKLRARRFDKKDPQRKEAEGFLRAVLSPSYCPIDDLYLFERIAQKFRSNLKDMSFIDHLGPSFWNDRASYFTAMGPKIDLGPIDRMHPDPHTRHIYDMAEKEGLLPEKDWLYQGFHMRNSEVGFTAVTIDSTVFRLVCLNGAVVSINEGRLLYRMHKQIEPDDLDALLSKTFDKMPEAWRENKKHLHMLLDTVLGHPEDEIKRFLSSSNASKAFIAAAIAAFETEALLNGYGVMQAIAKAAQSEEDMDKRREYESLAGRYLALAA